MPVVHGYLVFRDGEVFTGRWLGPPRPRVGEVVFNTSMTGYQEVVTDPSYAGQIVALTYPQVGNYGLGAFNESVRPQVEGLLVEDLWPESGLDRWLCGVGVPVLTGVDVRALVRRLRRGGDQTAALRPGRPGPPAACRPRESRVWGPQDRRSFRRRARWGPARPLESLVMRVTCAEPYVYHPCGRRRTPEGDGTPSAAGGGGPPSPGVRPGPHVVVVDYGLKESILRELSRRDCRVTVVPARTPAPVVLGLGPDAVVLSNGPGDPSDCGRLLPTVTRLGESVPTLGICLGHQLHLAVELEEGGVLARHGVRVLGTPLEAVRAAEDRQAFRSLMTSLGQPVTESRAVTGEAEAVAFARHLGYPVMVRPAYTLGGTGGGLARTEGELLGVVRRGLASSPIGQVLIERSLLGWAELEYEVMRDGSGTVVTVCNMENVDPVGVHTGDSIVVAPSQTLTDPDYHRLRRAAHAIIEALAIEGGCNVQFAYRPATGDYFVIEVNPRVSRSSALASKATGYPIARVAAKVALGRRLDEIPNPVTGCTYASFEPALDYVVVKVPRWPFDKFPLADRRLGTQMKATGEVMAIDRTFEGALQKAVRSLDAGLDGPLVPELAGLSEEDFEALLRAEAAEPTDRRLFVLAEALRRGRTSSELAERTGIVPYFLARLEGLVSLERRLGGGLTPWLLREAKVRGFSDAAVATLAGMDEAAVRRLRRAWGVTPSFYEVDTCAGEFPASSPYFYSTYRGGSKEGAPGAVPDGGGRPRGSRRRRALVLGAGPIRIGQGVEFDYCSVHAVWALQEAGWEALLVNNNPETVSTDFDTADRLYFEPLTLEHVLAVIEREKPELVFNQFGGQTALNLSAGLAAAGVPLAGTTLEAIDLAEDRELCRVFLDRLGLPRTPGGTARRAEEAAVVAARVGYPVMVRPSYVLGGRAMAKVRDEEELMELVRDAFRASPGAPVLIDRFIAGREVEVDAVSDGRDVVIGGIFEHVERAGVHSGDSVALYPPPGLTAAERRAVVEHTADIARALPVVGLVNVQFVLADGKAHVLEVNPRASRTVPILCKVCGLNLVALAVGVQLGHSLRELGVTPGLVPDPSVWTAKVPVFSLGKLPGVDTTLGPEMKSTGEVLGTGTSPEEALAKAYEAAGRHAPAG